MIPRKHVENEWAFFLKVLEKGTDIPYRTTNTEIVKIMGMTNEGLEVKSI